MPTSVTPIATNQSRSPIRSSVIVLNVRVVCSRLPPFPGVRTPATTVSLWTSRPAHRSTTTSIATFPAPPFDVETRAAREEPHSCRILTLVLAATVRCSRGSRVRLNDGLSHTKEIPTSPGRPTHSFHALCAAPPGAKVTKWKHLAGLSQVPGERWDHQYAQTVAETAYAPCGDLSLAYQVFGAGPAR